MFLQVQNKNNFLALHLTTSLYDWDMNEEIKLTITTDQFFQVAPEEEQNERCLVHWHYGKLSRLTSLGKDDLCQSPYDVEESQIQPNLWLMVNPTLACPIQYPKRAFVPAVSTSPTLEWPQVVPLPCPSRCTRPPSSTVWSSPDVSQQDASSSSEYLLSDDNTSSVDIPVCRKAKSYRKARLSKERVRKLGLAQSKRLQRVLQESNYLKSGVWPRPPVNYCILIAMALNSSRTGSLNVQQIYNFTREHFPFFQTAPDGWKNTIRHNLCFSNSFRKTPPPVSSEGKRKSCLWHLTLDGRRRLRDEIQTLTGESFKVLKRSMNNPDIIQALFEL